MSKRCPPAAASLLRGLVGPAALCLGRSMSLCGAPAACAAGPAGGSGSGSGSGAGFSSARLSPPWLRLPEVPGAEPHRANELLLLLPPPPAPRGPAPPQHHVVYFPGDVQVRRGGLRAAEGGKQWRVGAARAGGSGEAAPEGAADRTGGEGGAAAAEAGAPGGSISGAPSARYCRGICSGNGPSLKPDKEQQWGAGG